MFWISPLDHFGRPIPVPAHHLFGWRRQGVHLLLSLAIWMAFWFAVMMVGAAIKSRDLQVLIDIAPKMAVVAAWLSALFSFFLVAGPVFAWPLTRRAFGRQLEARIEKMNESELNEQIELCDRELDSSVSVGRKAALAKWRVWLQAKQAARPLASGPQFHAQLTLRPSRRKMITTVACGSGGLAAGLWLILLAILGGDGGTGIAGFSGPNAVWTKSIIGGLLVIVTAIPLIEALTVRVDLTAVELRKGAWGRRLWSIPTENVSLTLGDDGSWQITDVRTLKRVGDLNPHHFDDSQFLTLIGRLRPTA